MKVQTAAAMELAGIARHVWDDGLKAGSYSEAPPASRGLPRQFDRDDIVAMCVQREIVLRDNLDEKARQSG